jgi:succinate dehydrogenase / fumarate reductase iron-sulfur subunit
MNFTLLIWRQPDRYSPGRQVSYKIENISSDASFLEMLDILNDQLIRKGEDPIAFDSDCREGICGSCGCLVNGVPHGPVPATTVCQLFMRHFKDGDTLVIEPWRAGSFPVVKDLVVDRSAFDRIISAGGYVSIDAGGAPDGNTIPISKTIADQAFEAAACIGCGACVAACKNSSASLFVGAKLTQLSLLAQGHPERERRAISMVEQMEKEGFGGCSNEGECEAVCPKEISTKHISKMIREYTRAVVKNI